jgi:hypothetical protein
MSRLSLPIRAPALILQGLAGLAIAGTLAGLAGPTLGLDPAISAGLVSGSLLAVCAAPLVALFALGIRSFRQNTRAASFALAALLLILIGIVASG